MPLISVILPVYNAQSTIGRCIDSILAQTFTDFELIVVDDGSTDNSFIKIKQFAEKDKRIKALERPHSGAAFARNVGLDNAVGEWISFVDSDDIFSINYLESLINEVSENGEVDILIQGILMRQDGHEKPIAVSVKETLQLNHQSLHLWLSSPLINLAAPYAKLFKRDTIEFNRMRFDPEMTKLEDLDFLLRGLSKMKRVMVSPTVNYIYDYHPGSLSRTIHAFAKELYDVDKLNFTLKTYLSGYEIREYPAMYEVLYKEMRQVIAANNFTRYSHQQRIENLNAISSTLKTLFRNYPTKDIIGHILRVASWNNRLLDAVSQLLYRFRWSRRYHFA